MDPLYIHHPEHIGAVDAHAAVDPAPNPTIWTRMGQVISWPVEQYQKAQGVLRDFRVAYPIAGAFAQNFVRGAEAVILTVIVDKTVRTGSGWVFSKLDPEEAARLANQLESCEANEQDAELLVQQADEQFQTAYEQWPDKNNVSNMGPKPSLPDEVECALEMLSQAKEVLAQARYDTQQARGAIADAEWSDRMATHGEEFAPVFATQVGGFYLGATCVIDRIDVQAAEAAQAVAAQKALLADPLAALPDDEEEMPL